MTESLTARPRLVADTTASSSPAVTAVLLACVAAASIWVLHPHLGIRDVDGYAYVIGARSLHAGQGYRSLTGEAFNHWPPGYSLLLSVFRDSILGATVLNYLSFGIAVGLLYYLLRRSGWTWQAGIGFSMVLASGFFRLLANGAHADILTYAVFLGSMCAITSRSRRVWASMAWAILIPIKLIAVVFLPSALAASGMTSGQDRRKMAGSYAPAMVACSLGLAGVLLFNRFTIHFWIPPSHEHSSLGVLLFGARSFVASIPRGFLFDWHGSIAAPFPRVAFPVCLLLAAISLVSLRPASELKWFRAYGILCLICSGALLCVRAYDPSVRLLGYGLIVLTLGFRPNAWANWVWLLYGFASLAAGMVNATTVNSLGSADPRYAEIASAVRPYLSGATTVATNSFHLLDLHANIPSVPISDERAAAQYDVLLWVTLPNFDPGASPVTTIAHPGADWCEQKQFAGAVLFRRCKPAGADRYE